MIQPGGSPLPPTDRFPDGPFPDGYFPVGNPVKEEGDIWLYALQPNNDLVPHEFVVRAYRGEEMLGEKKAALAHTNRFGIDVEDGLRLENAADELLKEIR